MSTCRECQRAGGTTTVTDPTGRQVRITWSATYGRHDVSWWEDDGAGARRRRRRRAVRHDDAIAAARRALAALDGDTIGDALRAAGVLKPDTSLTVKALAEQWVHEVLRRDRERSEAYIKRCESQVRTWVAQLGTVGEWTEDATVRLLAQTGSVSSRRQLLSLLRQVSRWAWRQGFMETDVVRDVELDARRNGQRNRLRHGVPGVPQSPTTEQVEELREVLRTRGQEAAAAVVGLMSYSGLRRGEAFAVTPAQLDGHRLAVDRAVDPLRTAANGDIERDGQLIYWRTEWGCLQLPKGGRVRTTVVPQPIYEEVHELAAQKPDAEPLYLTTSGVLAAAYTSWDLDLWRPAARRAGWPTDDQERPLWTPHSLRAHAGEWLLEAGVPLRGVADLLGHASLATTDFHYVASSRDAVDRAWRMTSKDS